MEAKYEEDGNAVVANCLSSSDISGDSGGG